MAWHISVGKLGRVNWLNAPTPREPFLMLFQIVSHRKVSITVLGHIQVFSFVRFHDTEVFRLAVSIHTLVTTGQETPVVYFKTPIPWKLWKLKARSHWAAAKEIFFPSRMGNIDLYGAVHMDTCGKGNSKGVVINWFLCPIVTATATTKFPLLQLSVNEP